MAKECKIELPLYIDDTSSASVNIQTQKLVSDTNSLNRKTYIYVMYPLIDGEIFMTNTNSSIKYYVLKYVEMQPDGSVKMQIKRVDKANITDLDLDNLKKNTKIIKNGRFL